MIVFFITFEVVSNVLVRCNIYIYREREMETMHMCLSVCVKTSQYLSNKASITVFTSNDYTPYTENALSLSLSLS